MRHSDEELSVEDLERMEERAKLSIKTSLSRIDKSLEISSMERLLAGDVLRLVKEVRDLDRDA